MHSFWLDWYRCKPTVVQADTPRWRHKLSWESQSRAVTDGTWVVYSTSNIYTFRFLMHDIYTTLYINQLQQSLSNQTPPQIDHSSISNTLLG